MSAVGTDTTVGTYQVAGLPAVDFDDFHRFELPRRLADGVDGQVAWDVVGRAPCAVQLTDGRAYSYIAAGDHVEVVPGIVDDAELVLEMPIGAWQDYVYEFRTRFGLLYSQAVTFGRGDFDTWDHWEPAIRCMYSGREIYNPRALELRDLDGSPLDLHRSFTLADPPEQLAHFLRTTGFLVVRDAFADRLDEIGAEVDRLAAESSEGELWSWWASDDTGRRFPFRLLYMARRSELIASLDDDPMVRRLIDLGGVDVVPVPDRVEGHLAVLKPFGKGTEVTGFANLPWHKDCGLGGCPLTCPAVQVGIQLDAANADSSQLVMMAGSHGKVCHDRPGEDELAGLPIVALETEPGDASVHMTCALHAGPEPTGPNPRRTLYIPFYNPRTYDLVGELQGYQQLIPGWGGGDIPTPEDVQQAY
jgi:Phytanoyl-CoA dioxygenase (PhyH)